jgi:hypothetical protein
VASAVIERDGPTGMGHDDAHHGPPALNRALMDAGMKELNEMTIGRTDDPENPVTVTAFEAARLFGIGSRTHLG